MQQHGASQAGLQLVSFANCSEQTVEPIALCNFKNSAKKRHRLVVSYNSHSNSPLTLTPQTSRVFRLKTAGIMWYGNLIFDIELSDLPPRLPFSG
jgi:hypothetical protein